MSELLDGLQGRDGQLAAASEREGVRWGPEHWDGPLPTELGIVHVLV